jgi:RND family efflux transporter MFP subunit
MIRRTQCIAALLVTLIALAGCARAPAQEEEATPTPIPTPIVPIKPTYRVQRGEVVKTLEFTGRIAPVVEEELFFRTSGYVAAVYVKRDERVQAGDLLAELETTDLKNQLAQARADLEAIQLSTERQIAEAEANLRTAELHLAVIKADDPEPAVTIASVALERAQMGLQDAQKARQEALDQPWLRDPEKVREAADRQVREAELSLEVAEAQYQQALQARRVHNYNLQIQEQEVELARQRLQELEAGLDLKRAQLTVERLEAQLADAQVVAPFDGLVLSLHVTEGRMADAYKPMMIIADPTELEISAEPMDKQMRELTEGMPVTVAPVSRPGDEIPGHIRRLPYPYGGGGRTGGVEEEDTSTRVTLEMSAAEVGLERGDLVRITVVLERKDDVPWLPPQAIRTFEGRKFVVVQEGDAQLRKDVKVGIEGEDRVEIEEGLTEGQVVIGQ